ncbi:MAG: metal ABC transporter permease [Pseudomonadota bacterium]
MLDDFLVRAALAALGVALAAAPLGCFVVWRRMAYFSDATSHAGILGVALALAIGAPIFPAVLAVALAVAVMVTQLAGRGLATDTALGVLAHCALAAGLVAVSMTPGVRVDLDSFLFGDVLAVSRGDLAVIWLGALAVTALVAWRWSAWLLVTLNPDLAHAQGLKPRIEELALTLALALVVAVAIEVVGALLIGALLIIPAAAARPWSASPERMALIAALIGAAAALGGLQFAIWLDTPAGPSMVVAAGIAFVVSMLAATLRYGWS